MKFRPKKFLSLVTASLLAAGGLVGVAAAPAQAVDAPAPALLVDYEAEAVVQSPWNPLPGYNFSEAADTGVPANEGGWSNYVAPGGGGGEPAAASVGSTRMLKAKNGAGSYSGVFLVKTTTNSLLSAAKPVVSMRFWSPAAGKTVRMWIESGDYPAQGTIFVNATALTVSGWQTLRFDFSSANPNYTLVLNRAYIRYDIASTSAATADYYVDDVSFNGAAEPSVTGEAPSPALTVDYEAEAVVQSPWNPLPGYNFSEAADTGVPANEGGWSNYVAPGGGGGEPAAASVGSTRMLKAKNGAGSYSGVFLVKTTTNSLLSSAQPVVKMNFWSPAAGKTVRMWIESGDYPAQGTIFKDATAVTVSGWQTLTFDFSSTNPNYSLALNRAYIRYDTASTSAATADYFVDNVQFNVNGLSSGVTSAPQSPAQTVSYDIKLVSSQKNTATDAYQWTDCGGQSWCVNNNYFMKMIAAGASTTLNYVVTEHGTSTPVNNASVNLRINTANSGSNATWSSGGTSFGPATSSDSGTISGTTNSAGEVSFTFLNTNSSGEAARTLNNANPYPSGCASPAGQTKGAIEPIVTAVAGVTLGTQYVDVLWPHISSSTINSSIAAGSDGQNCAPTVTPRPGTKVWSPYFDADKKGFYPHVRLEKSFLNEKLDGTWWDGVWQNRDADTRAYLKYLTVGSTFALTYHVTDQYGAPYVGAKVSLIVNANYSCAKTFFAYEGSLIGPDDCAGGGETELPAKTVGADGRVTFVLTNTNTTGEAMPVDLNGAPNPATKEVGTNIKPNVVGAKQQGIDMLFAHFVEPTGLSKATGPAAKTATIGSGEVSEFTLTDDAGKPLSNTDVKYFVNGFDSKAGFARTDAAGKVRIHSTNSVGLEGMQTVGVSLVRDGKLPLAATATINWMAPELSIAAAGAANSVVVKVAGAAGKTVKITIAGKVYNRVATSANAEFTIATGAGKKAIKVSVPGKSLSKSVTVTRK